MENITIGEIASAIGIITVIGGAIFGIFTYYNKFVKRIEKLENTEDIQQKSIDESKAERLILMEGVLACLKGLHELNCNGPVTEGIKNIEE